MNDSPDLSEAARAWGVETSYFDVKGERCAPSPDALRAIVEVLASGGGDEARRPPQVHVVRRGRSTTLPNPAPPDAVWLLIAGDQRIASGPGGSEPVRVPDDAPPGTYRLVVAPPGPDTHLVLICPERAYEPEADAAGRRVWAIAAQLYAIRSRRNWGIGDFTDLALLVRIAADHGAAAVGLNPLHMPTHRPGQPSPYSPNSRMFLNPLYIDVEAVPEFPGLEAAGMAETVARLRAPDMVDYPAVAEVKTKALRQAFAAFDEHGAPERLDDFEAFKKERGEVLDRFAAFETLQAKYGPPWWNWPPEWRHPCVPALSVLRHTARAEMEFHAYVQWIADRQLAACQHGAREAGMPIGLYLDVAVGVEPDSADAWGNQETLTRELSIGAPPDMYNSAGQNWGLAALNAAALATSDFRLFRETLRAVMRHAGAIRLDHVLGLNRLFLIPRGCGSRDGTYVRFPLAAMLAVVAQESTAARCLVVGEDLGTVPEGFRATLADWNVWSYRVMLFERGPDGGFVLPEHYPEQALVSFGTHDLPTFAGWASSHDLQVKRGLGIDPGETDQERESTRHRIIEALGHWGGGATLGLAEATRFLARTPSRLLVVALEDVLGVEDQTNVPGTTDEHPNWRRRLPVDLEDIAENPRLAEIARIAAAEGRAVRQDRS